jgi:glucan biosynthesis protein C
MSKDIIRNSWVDNLRSFITLLVVAHHSSLAYTTFAYFNKKAYASSTHPIVDTARWKGLDIFEDFNDIFFMSLMFLISGIFVMHSLQHKGTRVFIRDRFYRLFIPFMIGVTILMPLAYYSAFYLAYGKNDLMHFIIDLFTVESWPPGPPWFIWVLFLFNLIFALCYPFVKNSINKLGGLMALQKQYPLRLCLTWYIFTWMLYVPIVLLTDPGTWTGIGPFDFQVSRFLLYFFYFLLGILIGAPGLRNGIFADGAALVKKWPIVLTACLAVYALLKLSEPPLIGMIARHQLSELQATLIYRSIWILSCTLSCIAFLSTFKAIFNQTNNWWKSLSENAYGIYLIHYIFVLWCQYYLLDYNLPPLLKFFITFIISVIISWLLTYLIRKNSIIKKYL